MARHRAPPVLDRWQGEAARHQEGAFLVTNLTVVRFASYKRTLNECTARLASGRIVGCLSGKATIRQLALTSCVRE
jgi:hypothetical protein